MKAPPPQSGLSTNFNTWAIPFYRAAKITDISFLRKIIAESLGVEHHTEGGASTGL